jgi:hypothetical protein
MRNRVVAHADELHLADVEFRVSQAWRHRAQETGQRNAHAFAVSTLLDPGAHPTTGAQGGSATRATYRYQDAVYHAAYADFSPDGQMFIRSG